MSGGGIRQWGEQPGELGDNAQIGQPGQETQLLLETSDPAITRCVSTQSAPFPADGTTKHADLLLRIGDANLNSGGNLVDPNRSGFENVYEFEYAIGGPLTVTAASNASPIVVTVSQAIDGTGGAGFPALQNGELIFFDKITGNTAANGFFKVKNKNNGAKTFELWKWQVGGADVASAGNGAYASGGQGVYRITNEWYVAYQAPGHNDEARPFGATFNNDGAWHSYCGMAGDIVLMDTYANVVRMHLPDAAAGDTYCSWGTSAAGVSLIGEKNNIPLISQRGNDNVTAITVLQLDGSNILQICPGQQATEFGGHVYLQREINHDIRIRDAQSTDFNGGNLTVAGGKANGAGVGGTLNLFGGGTGSGTKGDVVVGDANTRKCTVAVDLEMSNGKVIKDASGGLALTSSLDTTLTVAAQRAVIISGSDSEANSAVCKIVNTTSADDNNIRGVTLKAGFNGTPANRPILMAFTSPDGTPLGYLRQRGQQYLSFGSYGGVFDLMVTSTSGVGFVQAAGDTVQVLGAGSSPYSYLMFAMGIKFAAAYDLGASGAPCGTLFASGLAIGGTLSSKALIDLQSTTKGFLPPRMTTTQRDAIAAPDEGLMIYNTTSKKLNFYNGTTWETVVSA